MKILRFIKYTLLVLIVLTLGGVLCYCLPHTKVVQITGTDIKRMVTGGPEKPSAEAKARQREKPAGIRDVRFINTITRKGKVLVFRNEDTGWGWPPYFKFDSADLSAEAQEYATANPKPWVMVKYYGWRIKIFAMFPNAISLKKVPRDYNHFPLFNIIFLALFFGLLIYLYIKSRRLGRRIKERFSKKTKSAAGQGSPPGAGPQ